MIGIRVDGNEKIGTGHLMRCISIASRLKSLGHSPLFFTIDGQNIIKKAGFDFYTLPGTYDDLSKEYIKPALDENKIDTLLIDTYFADADYSSRIQGIKTARIFDFGDDSCVCDMVIDYNIDYDVYNFTGCKTALLGAKYIPLREEFSDLPAVTVKDTVKDVLITTGGTDKHNITGQLIMALSKKEEFENITFHVVIGGLNVHSKEIQSLAKQHNNFICYENIGNMAILMNSCDVILSAGGTTLYEICACAKPCVAFSIADNQDLAVTTMHEKGLMCSAGIYEKIGQKCIDKVLFYLNEFCSSYELRETFSKNGRQAIDGKGALRLAKKLIEL